MKENVNEQLANQEAVAHAATPAPWKSVPQTCEEYVINEVYNLRSELENTLNYTNQLKEQVAQLNQNVQWYASVLSFISQYVYVDSLGYFCFNSDKEGLLIKDPATRQVMVELLGSQEARDALKGKEQEKKPEDSDEEDLGPADCCPDQESSTNK